LPHSPREAVFRLFDFSSAISLGGISPIFRVSGGVMSGLGISSPVVLLRVVVSGIASSPAVPADFSSDILLVGISFALFLPVIDA
jgi:hypothetical protein